MNPKVFFIVILLLLSYNSLLAQIENVDNSVRFDIIEDDYEVPEGYKLPAFEAPGLTTPKNPFILNDYSDLGKEKKELLDLTFEEEFIDVKTNTAPKYFTKDKNISEEFGNDQYLGQITTNTAVLL